MPPNTIVFPSMAQANGCVVKSSPECRVTGGCLQDINNIGKVLHEALDERDTLV